MDEIGANDSTSNNASLSSKSPSAIENQTYKLAFSYSEIIPYTSHVRSRKNEENKNTSSDYSSLLTAEDYTIVWMDANIDESNEAHQNVIMNLQQVINSINTFTNVNECIGFVNETKDRKVFMVVSNDLRQQIVKIIQDKPQLQSMYVFGNDQSNHEWFTKECKKFKGMFTQIKYICESLHTEIRLYDNYFTTISSLFLTDTPIRDLDELDQSFMYSQLLKEILLEMDHNDEEEEMEELITLLRGQYANNSSQLRKINEFKQKYHRHSPVTWYTKEPFIYSTLNKALRTQNIDTIIKMGFFIRDLHRKIEQLRADNVDPVPLTVYRGQAILNTEFEKMRNCKGGLLSFNNFLSTTTDYAMSYMFAESNGQEAHMTGIVFEIEINPSNLHSSFAALNKVSYFTGCDNSENEILFSMNIVFRIGEMEELEDRLWCVKLTLTNDVDEQLKRVTDSLRMEIGEGIGWHRLGYLMIMMDEIDKAEEIYKKLLNLTPADNWRRLAPLYNQLGIIYAKKGDYETALSHFQMTETIEKQVFSSSPLYRAITYNNIADTYDSMEKHSEALKYHEKALEIRKNCLSLNHPMLAMTYANIAGVYRSMGKYQEAQLYYKTSLEKAKKSLPRHHPDLAITYNNVAEMHGLMGEYPDALSLHEKALKIKMKILPPSHASLVATYLNIISIHDLMGKYSHAFEMCEKLLANHRKFFTPNHPMLATVFNKMGRAYSKMGNQKECILYCQKALKIQEACTSANDSDLASTYYIIGTAHEERRELKEALSYYEKAQKIDTNRLVSYHPELADTYDHLGEVYRKIGKYSEALKFYQRAIQIREKFLWPDHLSLACSYNNMGLLYRDVRNYSKAIAFFEKALDIYKKSHAPNYPEWAITQNNLGAIYCDMTDYSTALNFFRNTLDIETNSLGSDHPNLAYTHKNIAYVLEGLQQYEKAFYHITKFINIAAHVYKPDDCQLKPFLEHLNSFVYNVLFRRRINQQS